MGLFALENLYDISLFRTNITYMHLLEYNLPENISLNNNVSVNAWFDESFNWNNDTEFWLQLVPICDENAESHYWPAKLVGFMNNAAKCNYTSFDQCHLIPEEIGFSAGSTCSPFLLGDGKCDQVCFCKDY